MAIGIVSDAEFLAELGGTVIDKPTRAPDSVPCVDIQDIPTRGRNEGDINVPDSIRALIGEEALLNGRASALKLGKDLGVSASSVSAYSNGATSTKSYNEPKQSIAAHIQKSRERALRKASKTLNGALGAITQEKLDYTDAKDLSGIAKDMSVIIRNLDPPKENAIEHSTRSPNFIIYAPQFRKEESFDVINVNE